MKKKSKKGFIWLIVGLIILVLGLSGYIIFDKLVLDGKESNNEKTNISGFSDDKDKLVFRDVLEKETCLNFIELEYYDIDYTGKSYTVEIKNDNNIYKYISDTELDIEQEYFNEKLIETSLNNQSILMGICSYQNYLFTIEGYEGIPFIKIISSDYGTILYENRASYEYDNGVLKLTSIIFDDESSDHIYKEILIDMTKEVIKEEIIKEKMFSCDDYYDINYDNATRDEQKIYDYCIY